MSDQKFNAPTCRECGGRRWYFVASPCLNKYVIECKHCELQQSTPDINAMLLAKKPKPKTWRDK